MYIRFQKKSKRNSKNIPPENYGRKTKIQNNWRFSEKPEEHVV